ncbi:VOC family protein [Diaminobutyricibacter sp. McL0618]|uniref:VOC family protein n=1 Tax=Leifsonia sp. McL0618 TaxID=3415677 RepID=UPI003CF47E56
MTSRIDAINITCRDHEALGAFWQTVLGLHEDPEFPNGPGDPETLFVTEPLRIRFLFQPTEPGEDFRPRIHFDVNPVDVTRDEEVERLLAAGAELVVDRRQPNGSGWVTLRDADGYELCVQRSQSERDAAS